MAITNKMIYKKNKRKNSFKFDSFILTFSKLLTTIIGFLFTMLLSRYRTLQEYGTYSQLLLLVTISNSVIMLGLPNSISYFIGRSSEENDRKVFVSTYYVLNTVLSVFSGILLCSLCYPLSVYFSNESIKTFWFFLLIYPWVYVTNSSIENLCVATKKTALVIPFRLMHSLLVLGAVIFSKIINLNFIIYIIIFLTIEAFFAVSVYIIAFKVIRLNKLCFKWGLVKKIFAFSIPIGLASSIGTLNAEFDKIIVGYFENTEVVAIYSNCARDLPFLIFSSAITASLLPRLSQYFKSNNIEAAISMWKESITLSLSIISLFSFGVFTFSTEAISILYSDKYLPGDTIFKIFCILSIFRSVYWGIILNCTGNTKYILFSSILSFVLNIVLDLFLYSFMGIIGCAIATLISSLAMNVFQLIFTAKKTKVSFKKMLPWKNIFLVLIINFAFSLFFGRTKEILSIAYKFNDNLLAIFLGILWALFYFLIMYKIFKAKNVKI